MSNVLISVPSELIKIKRDYMKKITYYYLGDYCIPTDWIIWSGENKETWEKFFENCVYGHMRVDDKIIEKIKIY